jgi:hypothetical protein
MLAAPTPFSRPMTNDSAGQAEKKIKLIKDGKERKRHLSPRSQTINFHLPLSQSPFFFHWAPPLRGTEAFALF